MIFISDNQDYVINKKLMKGVCTGIFVYRELMTSERLDNFNNKATKTNQEENVREKSQGVSHYGRAHGRKRFKLFEN
jgi:hypothetical protein